VTTTDNTPLRRGSPPNCSALNTSELNPANTQLLERCEAAPGGVARPDMSATEKQYYRDSRNLCATT